MNKKDVNEIVVKGQKIQTLTEEIDIFKLNYWRENPRINAIIKDKYKDKDISNEEIEKELWEKDSVKDLFKEIEGNGGLIDEILVKNNIVLEGNSRLCAYRHLYNKAKQRNDEDQALKWSYIRAKIIPEEISEEVIFTILGAWHIKGKTKWATYEKAAYLKRMSIDYGYSFKDIADSISETEKFVKDNIEAYDLMVKNDVYNLEKFSYFYELIKNKKNKELLSEDKTILPVIIQAIKEEKFSRAEEIRNLPKVLKDKKAKREFFNEGHCFNDALETTKNRHPEHVDSFYNNIKKITNIIEELLTIEKMEKIKEEIKADPNRKYLLENFYKQVNRFYKGIGIKKQE